MQVPSEMELRSPKEEQPTFDAGDSASGFNNPLYGAVCFYLYSTVLVAEWFFLQEHYSVDTY